MQESNQGEEDYQRDLTESGDGAAVSDAGTRNATDAGRHASNANARSATYGHDATRYAVDGNVARNARNAADYATRHGNANARPTVRPPLSKHDQTKISRFE